MSGLYVARLALGQDHLAGVARKIADQRAVLAEAGLETDMLDLSDPAFRHADGGVWRRRISHHLLFHREMQARTRDADFVYIRFQGAPPDLVRALAAIRARRPDLPVVMEVPSWPFASERRGWRSRVQAAYQNVGLSSLKGRVDRIVTFSQATEIFGIPTLRTDNGVNVEALPLVAPRTVGPDLHLVGVANLSFWHGYDRMIDGIARYRANAAPDAPSVTFDIAGSGDELPNLRRKVAEAGLEQTVRFVGPKHGDQLDRLMSDADIAVSSIGMHRLDVDTSNIKSREFCGRGIPFVIGYPDRDFPPELPFAHHVPADESPIDIAGLVSWYADLREGQPEITRIMRNYAEDRLSWRAKMAPVVDWLKEVRGS
ncbi:glycosyltransferase [Roseobacter sp. HKCCA0434]|uniref:glycosyltransferase n=1 Tax=Roseobacter sp. HKCCA0434 TaxID=3079297 RepID=UPI002905CA25|nr:glycosyltransferase [Roseobacter sp. HKCCA0434]